LQGEEVKGGQRENPGKPMERNCVKTRAMMTPLVLLFQMIEARTGHHYRIGSGEEETS